MDFSCFFLCSWPALPTCGAYYKSLMASPLVIYNLGTARVEIPLPPYYQQCFEKEKSHDHDKKQ
jgi:hypothetical protein